MSISRNHLVAGLLAFGLVTGGAGLMARSSDGAAAAADPVLAASASPTTVVDRVTSPAAATSAAASAPSRASTSSTPRPAAGPSVTYGTELPANWSVTGVAADDVLNVRAEPGARSEIIGRFGPDHEGIDSTGRTAMVGGQRWREVKVPGATTGWVAARYLAEM